MSKLRAAKSIVIISSIVACVMLLLLLSACASASPTPTPESSSEPLSSPTPSPTATATPTSAIASLDGLEIPDTDDLVSLITPALQELSDCFYQDPRPFCEYDAMAFNRVLSHEAERFYPRGLHASQDVEEFLSQSQEINSSFLRYGLYYDFLADHVIENLNTSDVSLENEGEYSFTLFQLRSYRVELDGDAGDEWLVRAEFYSDYLWISVDKDGEHVFHNIQVESPTGSGYYSGHWKIEFLEDISGDGLSDVLFVVDSGYMAGFIDLVFKFAIGTPNGFEVVSEIDASVSVQGRTDSTDYRVLSGGDGKSLILEVVQTYEVEGECSVEKRSRYTWPGGREQLTVETEDPAETPHCAFGQAKRAQRDSNESEAIEFFELALEYDDAQSDFSMDQRIFIHYRLALLYLIQYDQEAALQHLQEIRSMPRETEDGFANSISKALDHFLASVNLNAYALCQVDHSIFDIGPTMPFGMYVYDGVEFVEPLCPTVSVVDAVLARMSLCESCDLSSTLLQEGLPLVHSEPIQLPGVEGTSWIVIFDIFHRQGEVGGEPRGFPSNSDYYLLLFSPESGWTDLRRFSSVDGSYSVLNHDLDADGFDEIVIAAPLSVNWRCEEGEIEYAVLVIDEIWPEWTVYDTGSVCAAEDAGLNLETLFADDDDDGLPDGFIDEVVLSDDFEISLLADYSPSAVIVSLWSIEENLLWSHRLEPLDDIFFDDAAPSAVRSEAEEILGRVDDDLAIDPRIKGHLWYMIALSYENEGDSEHAVTAFQNVVDQAPDTLWAELEALRLGE